MSIDLALPGWLTAEQRETLHALAERNAAAHGDDLLGILLSGSAGRDYATERSDLDVVVVLTDEAAAGRQTMHSPEVDEAVDSWSELLDVPEFGTVGWWFRWTYARAPVLLDRTGGQLTSAALRQAVVPPDEADAILIDHDRLDGWVNFAYRALKNDRDSRPFEARLDAAESVPWLLDVVFSIAGRVRPYNKYLPWELRHHPVDGWPADQLLDLLARTLSGDAEAVRETFARVRAACAEHDERRGHHRTITMIDGWGAELGVFESQ